MDSSDIINVLQGDLEHGSLGWFNQSTLHFSKFTPWEMPSPNTGFPYNRLAITSMMDVATESYLYHQLSDTTFAEEIWDYATGNWTSNNITIDAS